nr:MAG TPA: hypothetical protein [Bacteriophage sp.]
MMVLYCHINIIKLTKFRTLIFNKILFFIFCLL